MFDDWTRGQVLFERYDIAICLENIEHIIDDRKLLTDIAACMKPGGRLLLTTPYLRLSHYPWGYGAVSPVEDGGHVRRGYTPRMLEELCKHAGLLVEQISYCSGFLSQKITRRAARTFPNTSHSSPSCLGEAGTTAS